MVLILLFVLVSGKINVSRVLSDSIVCFMEKLSLDMLNHFDSFPQIYWDLFVEFFHFLKEYLHVLLRLLPPSVHVIQLKKCATVKHFIWKVLLIRKKSKLLQKWSWFLGLLFLLDFSFLVLTYQSKNVFGVSLLVLQEHVNVIWKFVVEER